MEINYILPALMLCINVYWKSQIAGVDCCACIFEVLSPSFVLYADTNISFHICIYICIYIFICLYISIYIYVYIIYVSVYVAKFCEKSRLEVR